MNYPKNSFFRNIFFTFFGYSGVSILSILFTFVISSLYGAEVFGGYVYLFTLATIISLFAKFGMDNSLIYFNAKEGPVYNKSAFLITFTITLLVGGGIIFIDLVDNVPLILAIVFLLSSKDLFFALYRVGESIKKYYQLTIVSFSLMHLFISLIGNYYFDVNSEFLLTSLLISLIICNCILLIFSPIKFTKLKISKSFLIYSIPTLFISMVGVIMNKIDIIMIEQFMDIKSIGIYQVIFQIANITSLLLNIFNVVFAPKIAKLFNDGKIRELKKIYTKSTRLLALLGIFPLVLIVIYSELILSFFGDDYAQEYVALIIRTFGQYFVVMVGSVGFMLTMTGNVKLQFFRVLLACTINITLNYILIPIYGLNGAAFSSSFALLISSISGYFLVKKVIK